MDNLGLSIIMGAITILGVVVISKILPKYSQNEANTYKKMSKLDKEYTKKLEDEIEYLENEVKSLTGSLNRTAKGFKVEGKSDDWSELLPEIFGNFAEFAPKWLKPFLGNKDIQSTLMQKVMAEPDKYASIIGKFIGKKAENASTDTQESHVL